MKSRIAENPTAREFLQMVAGLRCPCGHLPSRHRKGDSQQLWGACRDCECRGLLSPMPADTARPA